MSSDDVRWSIIRTVACPRCGAKPNETCHTSTGKTHHERGALARGIQPRNLYTVAQLSAFARGEYTEAEAMAATKYLATQLLAARRKQPIP